MDRKYYHMQPDRSFQNTSPPATTASHFSMPAAQQPPVQQIPYSDPFHTGRDPFLSGSHARSGSVASTKAWTPSHTQGNHAPPPPPHAINQQNHPPHHHQQQHPSPHHGPSPPPQQPHHHPPPAQSLHPAAPLHPPPPSAPPNGVGMPPPLYDSYDPMRRRSLGGPSSPPRHLPSESFGRPHEQPGNGSVPQSASFGQRQMPPPSPTQNPTSSSHLVSAPRGPPTSSPFGGFRDFVAPRPSGMSIGSLLGREEERKPNGSPHSSTAIPAPTPKAIPSPGRARSASVRESGYRPAREMSPTKTNVFADRSQTPLAGQREGGFGSPQHQREANAHSFRAFKQEPAHAHPHAHSEHAPPMRPTSQPINTAGRPFMGEPDRRDGAPESRMGVFRQYEQLPLPRDDAPFRHKRSSNGVASQIQERSLFTLPAADRDGRLQGPARPPVGAFGTPLREEPPPQQFRPAYQAPPHHNNDVPREALEGRAHDMRYPISGQSPPLDALQYERNRNGFVDRPPTLEEHQRMEAALREQQFHQRRDGESTVHRAILNLSPELDRKGRNSPLPQAVQGAQPRHVGPGGDNPGIKTEFGRMFAGLGSGVGGATPHTGYTANGALTPSRTMSPARHVEGIDQVRGAAAEIENVKPGTKAAGRGGRKTNRRGRDDTERADTPGNSKRAKTAQHHHHHVHPHHHHHHHHHNEATEATPGTYNTMRFPSNPPSNGTPANPTHHHHHHHHAHPVVHHHHHTPQPPPAVPLPLPRQPSLTVVNAPVLEQCSKKPRQHLGSQLYSTQLFPTARNEAALDAKLHYKSEAKPFKLFEGCENSTFTIRVPRYYISSIDDDGHEPNSSFEEICRRRQLWGTDIYTDDSDPIAVAVHSGWLRGDFGAADNDMRQLGVAGSVDTNENALTNGHTTGLPPSTLALTSLPSKPVPIPFAHDVHLTLLILPPLERYATSHRNHIWSREWGVGKYSTPHDGMSFMIHRIDFVDESSESRYVERGAKARKARIKIEEDKRREAAAGLLLFAKTGGAGGGGGGGIVRVGA